MKLLSLIFLTSFTPFTHADIDLGCHLSDLPTTTMNVEGYTFQEPIDLNTPWIQSFLAVTAGYTSSFDFDGNFKVKGRFGAPLWIKDEEFAGDFLAFKEFVAAAGERAEQALGSKLKMSEINLRWFSRNSSVLDDWHQDEDGYVTMVVTLVGPGTLVLLKPPFDLRNSSSIYQTPVAVPVLITNLLREKDTGIPATWHTSPNMHDRRVVLVIRWLKM